MIINISRTRFASTKLNCKTELAQKLRNVIKITLKIIRRWYYQAVRINDSTAMVINFLPTSRKFISMLVINAGNMDYQIGNKFTTGGNKFTTDGNTSTTGGNTFTTGGNTFTTDM